jgi:hypothetical protein
VYDESCLATTLSAFEINNIGMQVKSPICYNSGTMFELLRLWFGAVLPIFHPRRSVMLENLALCQQIGRVETQASKTATRSIR